MCEHTQITVSSADLNNVADHLLSAGMGGKPPSPKELKVASAALRALGNMVYFGGIDLEVVKGECS